MVHAEDVLRYEVRLVFVTMLMFVEMVFKPKFCDQLVRQGAGSGAEFEDFVAATSCKRLRQLACQRASEQRRQLRSRHEIAARIRHQSELTAAAGVIAKPRRIQSHRHEAVEW